MTRITKLRLFAAGVLSGALVFGICLSCGPHNETSNLSDIAVPDLLGAPRVHNLLKLTPSPTSSSLVGDSVIAYQKPDFQGKSFTAVLDGTGETELIYPYDASPDGNDHIALREVFYKARTGEALGPIESVERFNPEGIYTSHDVFRYPRGQGIEVAPVRYGRLLPDGTYHNVYLFEDGSIERDRLFDTEQSFVSEKIYHWNRAHNKTYLFAEITQGKYKNTDVNVIVYNEDGKSTMRFNQLGATQEGQLLGPDGVTPTAEFSLRPPNRCQLKLYNSDHKEVLEWNRYGVNLYVVWKDLSHSGDEDLIRQYWKVPTDKPSSPCTAPGAIMTSVTDRTTPDNGKRIDMSDDGKLPVRIKLGGVNPGEVIKTLDPSGQNVVSIELSINGGDSLYLYPTPADQEHINPLAFAPLPAVPEVHEFADYGPDRIYDYRFPVFTAIKSSQIPSAGPR